MCRIEQFGLIYPDGTREGREQVVPCHWGTRSQPCRHSKVVRLGDRLVSASDLRPPMQPHIVPIEPQDSERSRHRPSSREKTRGPIEGITLNIKLWNPFSSKKKEKKKEKTRYYVARRTKKQEPRPPVIQYQPPVPPPPGTHFVPPVQGEPPVIIPIQPPNDYTTHHPPQREPRRRTVTVVHQSSEESASPPEASREHGRRTRSLSPISRYHVEKERQRELEQRLRRERIEREEREARERAETLAILERQRVREEQRQRQEENRQERREARQRQRLAAEREARRQEEKDRVHAAIVQEQEDRARLRAADHARQRREERARRYQEEAFRRAADRDRLQRLRDEERRYARARQANIPRHPRHPVFVHQDEDHLDRGERFIQEAIRAENQREFERRARRPRGGYDDGGLRRRNTVDGGQRWYGRDGWRRNRL